MPHIHHKLRERLLARAGLSDIPHTKRITYEELQKTQWSNIFEQWMRNRLIMGGMRYGLLGAKNKPKHDQIGSIKRRMAAYESTGNIEHLVDVANLCMVEYIEGDHPNKHFSAIDDGIHTQIKA